MKHFLFRLTWASMTARPLPNILTVATLAAAVSLISILLQFSAYTSERLARDLAGVDLVVGAKGSPLQLILSSLLHVDIPTGNIPLAEAQRVMQNPLSKIAVPLALGDSFRGFRIVGTNSEFLALYQTALAAGSVWSRPQQVIIGSEVSKQLGMAVGQKFVGAHGLSYSDADLLQHDHAVYEVVGVLRPHASIVDRLILTSVDSVWRAHEEATAHEEDHGEDHQNEEAQTAHHDDEPSLSDLKTMEPTGKAITALLVRYTSPIAAVRMPRMINEQPGLQAASPALEITRLYNLSSGLMDAGKVLAVIMTIIGGLSIFVAVSNAAVHRLYDIALPRAMGAKPRDIFSQQIFEGSLVALLSGLLGIGLAHLALLIAASVYGPLAVFGLNGSDFYLPEFYLLVGSLLVGMAAATWPAVGSYKVDPMLLLKGVR